MYSCMYVRILNKIYHRHVYITKYITELFYIVHRSMLTSPFMSQVFSDQDSLSHYIDGQSEPENWMKFVNCARHGDEQNLALVQDGDQLYYECCKDVFMGEELLVWYGKCYTLSMGIPTGLNVDVAKDEMMNELTGKG